MITITKATADDLDEICRIENESFAVPWSRTSFESTLLSPTAELYKADSDGNLVGIGCLLHVAQDGEIADIATDRSYRKQGIGRQLLEYMINEAAVFGCTTVYLEVRDSNTVARSLYRSEGFDEIGIRRGYYREPTEDAILMKKDISSEV